MTDQPEQDKKQTSILRHPAFEGFLVLLILLLANFAGFFSPSADATQLRPVPDAAEHAWVASAFVNNHSFSFPVVNEIHPTRYSVVHGYMASWFMWFARGELEGLQYWSVFATLLGYGIFYGWLVLVRIQPAVRIMTFCFLLGNVMTVGLLRNIMQEPSLVLMFSLSFLSFVLWQRRSKKLFDTLGIELLFVVGLCCGILAAIRLTLAPLVLLYLMCIFVRWFLYRDQFQLKKLLMGYAVLIAGFLLIILVTIIGQVSNSGLINLVGYHHWFPDPQNLFRITDPFQRPMNATEMKDMPTLMVDSLLGKRAALHPYGHFFGYVLLAGFLTGLVVSCRNIFFAWKQKQDYDLQSLEVLILALFSAGQFLVHCVYFFYDIRFFCTIYPGFVLVGIWGIQWLVVNGWKARKTKSFRIQLIGAIVLTLFGIVQSTYKNINIYQRDYIATGSFRDKAADLYEIKDELTEELAELNGPLFVYSIPSLNARLLYDLQEHPYPIAQIKEEYELYRDGHIMQFTSGEVRPALAELDPTSEWPRPDKSWIFRFGEPGDEEYDEEENSQFIILKEDYLRNVLDNYSEAGFLYHTSLTPVMKDIVARVFDDQNHIIEQNTYNQFMIYLQIKERPGALGRVTDE